MNARRKRAIKIARLLYKFYKRIILIGIVIEIIGVIMIVKNLLKEEDAQMVIVTPEAIVWQNITIEETPTITVNAPNIVEVQEVLEVPEYVAEPYIIECTAYIPTGNPCRDGSWPIEGETIAGMEKWLGRHCNLYYRDEETGDVGELIGTYIFHDTGFGDDPDGDGIGSIENGSRIDLFMNNEEEAWEWGVKEIYIEFLD